LAIFLGVLFADFSQIEREFSTEYSFFWKIFFQQNGENSPAPPKKIKIT
jgi:hypothetical protein